MANTDAKSGFKPLRHLAGGVIRANEYFINTSGTTGFNDNIFSGDVVALNADGTIETAAAGAVTLGIFEGCYYIASDGSVVFTRNWVASTAVKTGSKIRAMVFDDPNIAFEVQAATAASTDVGLVVDHVVGTGNATTGTSGSYIDVSDTTTSGGWRVLGLVDRVGNDWGAYAKVIVKPAATTLTNATGV